MHYFRIGVGIANVAPDPPAAVLDNALRMRQEVKTISDEEFTAMKAAVPVSAERNLKPVFMAKPNYPYELSDARVEGEAMVAFIVNSEGIPEDVHATRATHPLFAIAAADAVRRWRFAPALKEGKPVPMKVGQSIKFTLED